MSGRQIVILKLLGSPSVTDVVGNKIWPGVAEEGEDYPYILVHGPGKANRQLLEGDAGFPQSRVRVEVVAAAAAQAEGIGKLVFDAIKNVTNEEIASADSPPTFAAIATIVPTDFDTDGYSDVRQAHVDIADYYVDWRYA